MTARAAHGWRRGSMSAQRPIDTDPRAAWMTLISIAGAAERTTPAIDDLGRALIKLERAPFPMPDASARGAAAGLVSLAHAYFIAGTVERRELIAPAFVAAGKAVDAILHESAVALAQRAWLKD